MFYKYDENNELKEVIHIKLKSISKCMKQFDHNMPVETTPRLIMKHNNFELLQFLMYINDSVDVIHLGLYC